ncbi:hypothetical protein A2Z33_04610 [Candidatus Gottesmanbacteria bacterium RBG_16_52_11]|uniref:DNA-directed DNA polymerase n=1 Tax=Candidatus Gottesmanbacteria bacterium RBG_16_52_11 TaxID=1798374 RepID=A0A1F5YUG7_9BACT|nr:MAG: hypothetical protein A2Z33_04610 [Candidatus Gottesmanbacteria bacterium RBG_16_52_11]
MNNPEIAELLRKMAASYQILGRNTFSIIAYEKAADSIEHLTSEAKDFWDEGRLGDIPGLGQSIAGYLDELFRTGRVRHFEEVMDKVPAAVFPLLNIPGLGPKKAYKLVTILKLKQPDRVIRDVSQACTDGRIRDIDGFGVKSEAAILTGIGEYRRGQIKENRMVLPVADALAEELLTHLRRTPDVKHADALGSLRRQVSTIGDIDIAVSTTKPQAVVNHFLKFPHRKVIEKGPTGASLLLTNGRQVDLRVQKPDTYGSMLQYFTGSKHHNIALRNYALGRGYSLSEYGIKQVKTGNIHEFKDEESFYRALGLPFIPPEIREDRGEIDAARNNRLPKLLELPEIKGDLHTHSLYNLEPSHDLGSSSVAEYLKISENLGYEYIGFSDHNPSISTHTEKQIIAIMKKRKVYYEQQYSSYYRNKQKRVQMFIMCEADILTDGKVALPAEAFRYIDAAVVSIHGSFRQPKDLMTSRVVRALTSHPKVRIFGHPTARLLGRRESIELDWKVIFGLCRQRDIALEINAYPDRLDLPDLIVHEAVKAGVRLIIDTDSHQAQQMYLMKFGVSVARRGWATGRDIANTLDYNTFAKWLVKGE